MRGKRTSTDQNIRPAAPGARRRRPSPCFLPQKCRGSPCDISCRDADRAARRRCRACADCRGQAGPILMDGACTTPPARKLTPSGHDATLKIAASADFVWLCGRTTRGQLCDGGLYPRDPAALDISASAQLGERVVPQRRLASSIIRRGQQPRLVREPGGLQRNARRAGTIPGSLRAGCRSHGRNILRSLDADARSAGGAVIT